MIYPSLTLAVNVDLDAHTNKFFDSDPITDGNLALTNLSHKEFAAKVEILPGNPRYEFACAVEFDRVGEVEQCIELLGCPPPRSPVGTEEVRGGNFGRDDQGGRTRRLPSGALHAVGGQAAESGNRDR